MKSYREIAENVLERRDRYLEMQKRRKLTALKIVSSVVGIAAACCLSITVYNSSTIQKIKPNQNNSSYNANDYTKPTSETSSEKEAVTTSTAYVEQTQTTSTAISSSTTYTCNTSACNTSTTETTTKPVETVIPPVTTVHFEYTSAIRQTTISVPTTAVQTHITSTAETYEVNTAIGIPTTAVFHITSATPSMYTETAITASAVWTTGMFTEETMFLTTAMTDEETAQTSTTTTAVQTYVTSLIPETTETVPTEIPETFVLSTTTDYRKFSDTETSVITYK